MTKFKKCGFCGEIASYKVWLRDTKTNKRYSGIAVCKICYKEKLEENKQEFAFLDVDSHDDTENILVILTKTVKI